MHHILGEFRVQNRIQAILRAQTLNLD